MDNQSPNPRPLVIYHGECFDGFTAAWAARKHFMARGVEPEFFGAVYPPGGQETKLPDIEYGREVYMLDFCVSRDQLQRIEERTNGFRVLDHHKTHEDACKGLPYAEFDMNRSGAAMAWDFFSDHGGKGLSEDHRASHRPWLVNYVQDRDLWRFALNGSKAVNAYIMCQEMTWENWDAMTVLGIEEAEARGIGAELYLERYVRDMKKIARRMRFPAPKGAVAEGVETVLEKGESGMMYFPSIPVVNAPYLGTSELVGALAEDALFAVGWFQRADGLYQYSLRSRSNDFDVSALAKEFGGGGHPKAAGFTTDVRVHDSHG